jgi:nucleoside-diphosphate-sugar epimerase
MGRVLILGGTGAMGYYLVPELLRHNHEVHVTSRTVRNDDTSRCHYICGNAHSVEFIESVTSHTHYDAIIDFMVYSTSEFTNRYALLLQRTGHYLFVSSYRVFADTGVNPITERSPRLLDICDDKEYLATDEYALAKARQEDILRYSGLNNWTILRPCITYSRNRFQLGTLEANTICYRALQNIPVLMAREILSQNTTMTWAGDVARLIARLILNERTKGEDFNVVTNEYHTWSRVASYYQDVIGLQIVETDLKQYTKVIGGAYQIQYDRLFHRILDNRKVLQTTGIQQSEFLPLKVGLRKELNAFKSKPCFQYSNLGLNARMDKATNSRINLNGLTKADRTNYLSETYLLFKLMLQIRAKVAAVIHRLADLRAQPE